MRLCGLLSRLACEKVQARRVDDVRRAFVSLVQSQAAQQVSTVLKLVLQESL